ncbi:hypothetical protein ROZALSC1DRAFT_22813 [Rozella allomycis CSF55]|uniref:Uncharacterized protein n=1 Tax=Rozella allomycis (strain CSF55) TaxID=988480 RepID=A0A4P9YH34_ROZAC|nr:hypothetical protein ROZALSC1DRAFT_22813 [Rozella allomycis CSF55]
MNSGDFIHVENQLVASTMDVHKHLFGIIISRDGSDLGVLAIRTQGDPSNESIVLLDSMGGVNQSIFSVRNARHDLSVKLNSMFWINVRKLRLRRLNNSLQPESLDAGQTPSVSTVVSPMEVSRYRRVSSMTDQTEHGHLSIRYSFSRNDGSDQPMGREYNLRLEGPESEIYFIPRQLLKNDRVICTDLLMDTDLRFDNLIDDECEIGHVGNQDIVAANNMQYSHVVSHHSTNYASTSLTSGIRRDPVLSGVYQFRIHRQLDYQVSNLYP